MSTVIERSPAEVVVAGSRAPHSRSRRAVPFAGLLAVAGVALGLGAAVEGSGGRWLVAALTVVAWAVAGVVLSFRRGDLPLGPLVASVALVGGATALGAAAFDADGEDWSAGLRLATTALLVAVLFHLAMSVPDGRLRTTGRRVAVGVGYLVAAGLVGVGWSDRIDLPVAALVGFGAVAAVVATFSFVASCRAAGRLERAALQWMGWGVVTAGAVAVSAWGLDALIGWPRETALVALAASVIVPFAFVASTYDAMLAFVDRLLVHTFVTVGLIGLVGLVYFFVVVGLGRVPEDSERSVLGLSMVAAGLAVILALPARRRLEEIANQRVYGERRAPDDALKTFATRMSRVVPMDELLLQLAESLRKTMALTAAEIWTGADGDYERVASVPDRGDAHLTLSGEELTVVARAHVSGNAWVQVWMPSLLERRSGCAVRVASIAHLGELLGLLVLERPADAAGFTEEEDQVLTDLARQVGLALHNVRLDSALQASLDELKERNLELQASRLRIVSASDESRRRIERNLHDGAQQHLVAMAVKLGLARQLVGADQATAEAILEELRTDVQTTLTELRELAHGIYPPLLRDRGLAEALRTAANRAVLPVDVQAGDVGRYSSEMEAAVYFCCLEAMQNAGKYAGPDASIVVAVTADADHLSFAVTDDGPGFEPGAGIDGHGFVNMRDRLGALGGELTVVSEPGCTRITGRMPITDASTA